MIVLSENEIFNELYNAIPTAKVVKGNPEIAPSFPCVTVKERLNTTNRTTKDTSGEFANDVTYEINIFSNSETPIAECDEIRVLVDGVMSGTYGMNRTFSDEVPNYQDENIYRYLVKYQGIIDKNGKVYGG